MKPGHRSISRLSLATSEGILIVYGPATLLIIAKIGLLMGATTKIHITIGHEISRTSYCLFEIGSKIYHIFTEIFRYSYDHHSHTYR